MKIVSFSATDGPDGAGLGSLRLHKALLQSGHESTLLVWKKTSQVDGVKALSGPDRSSRVRRFISVGLQAAIRKRVKHGAPFATELLGCPTRKAAAFCAGAEILQVGWVDGFLTARQMALLARRARSAVVWTLMDQAPVTGGCHYPGTCERYTEQCGCCPVLSSKVSWDFSRYNLWRKRSVLAKTQLGIVPACSQDRLMLQRSIFAGRPSAVIPVPVDEMEFQPLNQKLARTALRVASDKSTIFFGAYGLHDDRKGMKYLLEALAILAAERPNLRDRLQLVVAGRSLPPEFGGLPFDVRFLGILANYRALALAYQSADLFVSPSISDSGPMMVLESLLCGTPVVAFPVGYAPDILPQDSIGYIADRANARSLAEKIAQVLDLPVGEYQAMRARARAGSVRYCSMSAVAQQYIRFYNELGVNQV